MIQRIQTLFLLIAIVITLVASYYFIDGMLLGVTEKIAYKMFEGQVFFTSIISGMLYTSALISVITIFLFKNRTLQLNLGKLNILINLLLLGLSVYLLLTLSGEISFSEKGIGVIVPSFIVLILVLLANRAIKKDENLVKSVDRLR